MSMTKQEILEMMQELPQTGSDTGHICDFCGLPIKGGACEDYADPTLYFHLVCFEAYKEKVVEFHAYLREHIGSDMPGMSEILHMFGLTPKTLAVATAIFCSELDSPTAVDTDVSANRFSVRYAGSTWNWYD